MIVSPLDVDEFCQALSEESESEESSVDTESWLSKMACMSVEADEFAEERDGAHAMRRSLSDEDAYEVGAFSTGDCDGAVHSLGKYRKGVKTRQWEAPVALKVVRSEILFEAGGHVARIMQSSNQPQIGTGCKVWPVAGDLCNVLASCGLVDPKGKVAIELGAGVGLLGIMFAKLGARRVICTDIDAAMPLLIENVEINGVTDVVKCETLNWGRDPGPLVAECSAPDLILCAGA